MKFVNRIALVIHPRQPLLDWICTFNADEAPSLEELRNEASLYLLDEPLEEMPQAELLAQLIDSHYRDIFANELAIWDEYGDHQPASLDRNSFDLWFDVSLSGLTFDLAKAPLMRADVEAM